MLTLSGCVSQARHDQVQSQLERAMQERDAERRKSAELDVQVAELEQTLTELQKRVANGDAALDDEREQLAQVKFQSDVIDREREEAKRMSDQLLVELERVSTHLRMYANDKEGLAHELGQARDRLAALALDERASQQRFRTARQLTLALAEPLQHDRLRLTLVDGNLAIQFPGKTAFAGEGAQLSSAGRDVLKKTALVLTPLDLRVSVEQPQGGKERAERAKNVSDALVSFGLDAERVSVPEAVAATESDEEGPNAESGADSSAESGAEGTAAEVTADADEPSTSAPEAAPGEGTDTELELLLRFPSSKS
jgi:flagellar motor protein MotB